MSAVHTEVSASQVGHVSNVPGAHVENVRHRFSSLATPIAFVFGVCCAVSLLAMIERGPLDDPIAQRYVSHPVEKVEVLLFFVALGVLLAKVGGFLWERVVSRREILPPWDGRPMPVSEAGPLRARLERLGRRLRSTYLVRRIAAVLDFVRSRQSANDLDDQLRSLADNDAAALDNSYSLIRFITWAIPILGFLGTVLGITEAIAGVTPEKLEKDLSPVTDGLALAFDTTALALALTMILMFVHSLVDRCEQGLLASVDRCVEDQLAHRFVRHALQNHAFAEAVQEQTQLLLAATEKLVERQAAIWAGTLEKAEHHWHEAGQKQQEQIARALEKSLARALDQHAKRLEALESRNMEQTQSVLAQLAALTQSLRDTGREQQQAQAQWVQQLVVHAETLGRLEAGGQQLVHLEDLLQQNLATLIGSGKFEEAVHSLTAAIHLLTARAGPPRGAAA